MEAVDVVRVGAGDFDVFVGDYRMSMSAFQLSRSRVLSQMIAKHNKLSLRLPCGYLEAWLACIRSPPQSNGLMRSLDTSVKMLNVRCFLELLCHMCIESFSAPCCTNSVQSW